MQSPSFQTWLEEATAAVEQAQSRTKSGEELRLTAALRAQQTKVEKIATTLVEVGVSETLRTMLLREEERLRELRRELKDVSLPVEVREAFNLRQAAKGV